jgi:16S rRNA (guanine527-N7)-methyltransferase
MDSSSSLRKLMARFSLDPDAEAGARLTCYLALLEKWNGRINLTASVHWSALGSLFEEALWAAQLYPAGSAIHLDIGSGAGFPAIPMRIVRSGMQLCLVESRGKRAVFLETAAAELGLAGTAVVCDRIEAYLRSPKATKFDVVSWKGLKLSAEALALLLSMSKPEAQFWLFHGKELPVADPARLESGMRLVRREHFPGRRDWKLSIFQIRYPCFT